MLNNLDKITNKGDPSTDNEISTKKQIDDSIRESTIVRYNQTLKN